MDRRRAAGALLALAACIACSAAAPTASNHTALDLYEGAKDGCYYNFQHYGEGDRIMTNEPCLNCTCHNRMLMCYLRVCPFTKPIGQDCTVEKRADQCCPIVTCPDVPVDLLTSTSTTSPAEYGATGLGKQDKYGCSINGRYLPEGSKVPPTPNKPCEHCYCIRNMTTCVMQECTLHVDGCTPIYHKDVCCPVRYSCDHPEDEVPLLDDMSTTVRPTPGFLLTTTTISPVTQMSQDCVHNDQIIADGASITTEKACEHCYCMKGDIVCVVQECGAPMENEGKNCTSLPPREGQCCPDTYICEGDEPNADVATESVTDTSVEKLTISPPRRTGVEGSGYRNEDELAHTQMPTMESELEGSGEEQDTPHITQEPVIPGKPLDTEEITHTLEEGDQYIPVTPKASESVSQVTESSSDGVENETIEPEISMITTQHLTEEDFEKVTEGTKIETENPYEQEPVVSPGVTEGLEHGTMEPSDFLNTVPDILPEQAHDKPHEFTPTTMGTPKEETDTHVQKESEHSISTSIYDEQGTTLGSISHEPSVSDYTTESLDSSIKIKDATTEKPYDVPESVTKIDTAEPEKHVDSKVTVSDLEEIRTLAPQTDTAPDKTTPEEDSASSIEYASTIPTIEKEATDLDQASMVGVVEEEIPISDVDSAEKTPPFGLHIDTTSPVTIEKDQEQITGEPDKGLNTIPNEIDEETTQASLLETRNTEPTISVDATDRIESDTKLSTVSETSTSLLETHVSKGDQYTVTTEPSFRREDEASVSTEKPKEGLEITTVKTDLVDEGLIPTSMDDKEPETGSNISSVDEYITTGIPDYIDTDKELEDTVASVKPVTESVLTTKFGLDTVTEKVIGTTLTSESGLPSSTEKIMEVTLSPADDSHYEPSRIPGEGDCLLNAVTYRNNTVVPSTNKCHIRCKCISSIIKCDPVVCSPLPENMHNCQSIYDNPDSCCPTYICDSKETHPPKSDSQMSGTEVPVPPPVIECRGDQCELSVTKEPTKNIEPCTSDSCVTEVVQDSKSQDTQQTPCNEENGCKSQEPVPLDCTGDEPCRRKDSDKDQTSPPKCEGSHCVQQIGDKETETSIPDKIPTESIPIEPTKQVPSQPIADSQVTKHGDTTMVPQIVTENVYESTEHSLFATTEKEIISDKITEKIDVDIATEEFIPAGTEGTKKPDLFEQDGTAKPTTNDISQTVDTKEEDNKKPTAGEIEDVTHKPETHVDDHINKITPSIETVTYLPDTVDQGYTDEPTIIETQDEGKPQDQPDKPVIGKEEDANVPHDAVDENIVKPSLTDAEGTLTPIITEEQKISDTDIEEQTDINMPDITDKDSNDKLSYTDSPDTNVSDNIIEIDPTQSVLIEQDVTKTPDDVSQNLDSKLPQLGIETTETPTYIEKDINKAPDTEKDIKIPDLTVGDKTDRPISIEDSFTKVPEIKDDKYTESIPISDDRNTIKPEAGDEAITDVPLTVDEHTIKINVPDEQSSKPDDFLIENKVTETPELDKEDKIIPIEEVSTKLPAIDVENYTDKTDVTGQESTPLLDDSIGKQTESPFVTPEISESVTEKHITTGDEDENKPDLVDKLRPDAPTVATDESSEKTESDKEESITQSAISEESTGLPEMVENVMTIKPFLIDESTDLSVDVEDTKVTNTMAVTEEITTDKNILTDSKITDKPSVTEEGTKIPDVLHKDEDNELIDVELAQETLMPETQASTQASITTEHELSTLISDADGVSIKDEKQTGEPAHVTPVSATEIAQTELYVTSTNEQLPEVQTVGKDKIPPEEDILELTPGPGITQTSSVSPISEQDIKPVEPEIYTPEKEEMITSSIDSVTEPSKSFTEIDDVFATEPEETTAKSEEKSTERIELFVTDKEIPDTEIASELSVLDEKTTKAPEEPYTESHQGYGETTVIAKTELSHMSQKPEITTPLPVSAEPTRRTDSENKIIDSSEPTFTDLPLPAITLAEEKPTMPLDNTDSQNEKDTKVPDSDLGTPASPTEMYVTEVQTLTGKPESHVTESAEEQANVEQSAEKPKLPQTVPSEGVDIPAPEKVPLEEYPHVQVITEAGPLLVTDHHPDLSDVDENTSEKDDNKQTSPENLTERPHIDLEVTKPIEETNIFTESTPVHADISETTPYLVELEEHTHKIAEYIPDISTTDKEYTYQATEITTSPRLEEENINSIEDSSTISPATEKYEGEKGSYTEMIAEKEISTTEKTTQPDIHIDTEIFTLSVDEIIDSSTTQVPEKIATVDSDDKYGEPSVKPTSEEVPIEPSLSEDKESKPEDNTDTEQTLLHKDEDRKPDEEIISGGEEIITPTILDKDGEPDRKPIMETTDIVPVSDNTGGQTEKGHITGPEETLSSTIKETDKKPDEQLSADKNERPDELSSSETKGKPSDKPTSEIDETTPSVTDDKYTKPDAIISKETTIPSTSTYDKPGEQPTSESGEMIIPLSEEKGDKPDITLDSQTEVTTPTSLEDMENKFVSQPESSEIEETTPSITEDNFIKPDEQSSGESGDIELPHSEQTDDKDKPSSGPKESVPSVSVDKYVRPDVTQSGEAQTTVLPGYQDKDRKPDGQPIDEIESSTLTSSGEPHDMSDKPSSEIDDNIKPLPSLEADERPDEKPITDTEQTYLPSTENKYDRPDVTDSSETGVTSLPISVGIASKPVEESEKTTSIPEDKYGLSDDKFTTEIGDILPSLPGDEDEKSDKKPAGEQPEEITPPSSEEKYDKPDLLPGSETETGIPPLSEDIYGKPTGQPSTDTMGTTLPVSTDKYDKVDEKPSMELDKIVPPTSEDKDSKPDEKPISGTEDIAPTVSDDDNSKPEKKPNTETEDIMTLISEEKDGKPEEKPNNPIEDIVPTISDDKVPSKEVISGAEQIAPTVLKDKDGLLEKDTTIQTGGYVSPISEDKVSKPEQQSTSSSEETTSEDKDSKPTIEPEQTVPTGSEENDIKPEEKPVSGIEVSVPSVSKDKDNQPEEESVSEIVPPAIEDKDSKPDEKPVSGSEETVPSVAEEDDSKTDKKPISEPAETMLPGAEEQENKADEKPTSEIEEILPPVVKDKDTKPDDESITEIVETMPPTSEDKYDEPDEAPTSESGGSTPTTHEVGDDKFDNKPISKPEDIVPLVTQDKDSKPQEKPISALEETEQPVTGDKVSKPDEKPSSDIEEPVQPSSEDKEHKPDEKPLSEIEGNLPPITEDKESIPEEVPTRVPVETTSSTPVDNDSKPGKGPISESGDTSHTEDKDSKPEGKPISELEETAQQVTEDKDSKPEDKPIAGDEETIPPVTKDKDSQSEEKPISGTGEPIPSDSGDKITKPDDTLSSENETPVSEDKYSKPGEKPISSTEEIVAPVTDDKFAEPEGETGATVPPTSEDKYSKPDEIPTSQTTESTPPVAADNYGKPDGQSSEGTPPTSATSEIPKPLAEPQPTDELPVPEEEGHFPPSGTGYGEPDYVEEDQAFGPGTCRYGGKVYVSAQQIPRDDPCDFCFCFRSDIICLQQSCPPPIHGCHEEPIQGFCCPRYECPVSMATTVNVTTTTTTTTTTLPPHFPTHSYKGAAQRRGCQIKGHTYKVGDVVRSSSGPCLHCTCGGDGQMKCDPKACTPEPMLRQMIAAAVSAKRRR